MNAPSLPTVGQKLRRARENQGISLLEAARGTRIKSKYLQELENDHPELLHSEAQARGFLRLYADYLGLDYESLVSQWDGLDESASADGADFHEKPAREEPADADVEPDSRSYPKWKLDIPDFADLSSAHQRLEELNAEPGQTQEKIAEETATGGGGERKTAEVEKPGILRSFTGAISGIGKSITGLPVFIFIKKKKKQQSQHEEKAAEKKQASPEAQMSSDEMFKEIGNAVRQQRLILDLNLADIEHFTNLKRMYLTAIEDGRFNDLPSTVQGRGMLNMYASFLGMDENAVMDRYAEALQTQREERMAPQKKRVRPPVSARVNMPDWLRRVLSPDLIVGGAIIIGLFAFIMWGAFQVLADGEEEPTEALSISDMLQVTQTATQLFAEAEEEGTPEGEEAVTPLPAAEAAQPTPTIVPTVNAAPLQLYIIANDRAFLSVTVDGFEAYYGRVAPKDVLTFSGQTRIELLTGNAAALEVYFNQDFVGPLGDVGEVVEIDFSLEGQVTATPRPTRTPTPDLREPAGDEGMTMEES